MPKTVTKVLSGMKGKIRSKIQRGSGAMCSTPGNCDDLDFYDDLNLIDASLAGNFNEVKRLLEVSERIQEVKDRAFLLATKNGNTNIVAILLEKGADVNTVHNYTGLTALMLATTYGYAKIVRMLLDKGADVNMKDNRDNTALDIAKSMKRSEIVSMLLLHTQTIPKHLKRQEDRKNLDMVMSKKELPYELQGEIEKYLGGGKRKTRMAKKIMKKKGKTIKKRKTKKARKSKTNKRK